MPPFQIIVDEREENNDTVYKDVPIHGLSVRFRSWRKEGHDECEDEEDE